MIEDSGHLRRVPNISAENRTRLIRSGAVWASALTLALALLRLVLDEAGVVSAVLGATAMGFAAAGLLARGAPRWRRLAAPLLPVVGWTGASAMALADGGLQSEALFWLPFTPLLAAITGDRRSIASLTGLAMLTPLVLLGTMGPVDLPSLLKVAGLQGAVAFAAVLGIQYERFRRASVVGVQEHNRALRSARELLTLAMENLKGGIAITDEHARLTAINRALCDIFGLGRSSRELAGRDTWEVLRDATNPPQDLAAFKKRIVELARVRQIVRHEEITLADGRVFARDFVPIMLDGDVRGHLWSYQDITARVTKEEEILDRLHTDLLTGAKTRRYLDHVLETAFDQGERGTALYLDLDGFKTVNDTHGHDAGDEVLRQVVRRLEATVRASDVVARIGGDEFVVLLTGLNAPPAIERVCEQLVETIARPVEFEGGQLRVGASIGVASWPDVAADPASLLRAADAAMYEAKEAGKGRFNVAQDTEREQQQP